MEFNQVRYFLTLAKILNFTRAAETCNVTQPALTRAIQKLEEEMGGLLFYRERNLTQLTELGQLMLPHLEQADAAARAARKEAIAFKRRDRAPLRLGLDCSISPAFLMPVLSELASRIQGLELTMRPYSTPEACRLLLESEIDVGIAVATDKMPERLNRWILYEEGLVVLCSATHRFAAAIEVSIRELAAESILRREVSDCAIAATIETLCLTEGVSLRIQHAAAQEEYLHEMVKASLGIAVAAARQPVPAGLVAKPLAGARRSIVLTAVAGRQHGPGVSLFLKLMRASDWVRVEAMAAA